MQYRGRIQKLVLVHQSLLFHDGRGQAAYLLGKAHGEEGDPVREEEGAEWQRPAPDLGGLHAPALQALHGRGDGLSRSRVPWHCDQRTISTEAQEQEPVRAR